MLSFFRYLSVVTVILCSQPLLGYTSFDKAPVEKVDRTARTDELLKVNRAISTPYLFEFEGHEFIGFPNVFSPLVFPSTSAVKNLPIEKGISFLEIGSGTGVFSIQAALKGAARVVSIDINPSAVLNTQVNAALNGVSNVVTAELGDVYKTLRSDDHFDVVFWSVPFCHRPNPDKSMDLLALSVFDPQHELLKRYLQDGKRHLKAGGYLLLSYSTTHGDIQFLEAYANEFGWRIDTLKSEKNEFISVELYKLTPDGGL